MRLERLEILASGHDGIGPISLSSVGCVFLILRVVWVMLFYVQQVNKEKKVLTSIKLCSISRHRQTM